MIYIISGYIFITLIYGLIKKINCYDTFLEGVREGSITVINMFSCLLTFVFAITCLENCGIINDLENFFTNIWIVEILLQAFVRPLSSGSSLSIMLKIYDKYGVDSVAAIASTFIHTSCDTLFYIVILYCSSINIKNYKKPLKFGLFTIIISYVIIIIIVLCYMFLFNN